MFQVPHLFCGRRTLDVSTESTTDPVNLSRTDSVRRMKLINSIMDHFWKRWSREYLVDLRESHIMKTKQKKLQISEGDVVLIHEENVKRNRWRLGRIQEVIFGKDGVPRGAFLRTCKDGNEFYIKRPLQKLYPLELTEESMLHRQTPVEDPDNRNQEDQNNENDSEKSSEFLGSLGFTMGGGISQQKPGNIDKPLSEQTNDNLERVLSEQSKLKSRRIAAIDGQIRRRFNDLEMN